MSTTVTLPSGLPVTLPTFPTTAEVLASLQAAVEVLNGLITNFNAGGVVETYLEGASLALGSDSSTYPGMTVSGAYEQLALVQNAAYVLTASGTALDLKAADLGVTRKAAVAATGPYVFTIINIAVVDTVIAAGATVASESADPTATPSLYTTQTDATIPAGSSTSNTVQITAVNGGSAGNAPAGGVTSIISGASGVTGSNPQPVSGGANTEGDDTPNGGLRARVLLAIPNASQGTISALEEGALSFAGVVSALLVENTNDSGAPQLGIGQLYIDDGSGNLGSSSNPNFGIIATVQAAFTSGLFRAAGTQVNIVGSQLLPVFVTLDMYVAQSYITETASEASVIEAVQTAIYNYVEGLAIGKTVFRAEIIFAALGVPGVVNVSTVAINAAAVDLVPTAVQCARCASLASITPTAAILAGY